jgi:hypothetical protein
MEHIDSIFYIVLAIAILLLLIPCHRYHFQDKETK